LAEACKAYELAVRIHPDSAKAHFNLGNIHKDLGQFDEAATCYRQALAIDPEFARAWCHL
jgi:tetratricopeptide (TPR) repeat protein